MALNPLAVAANDALAADCPRVLDMLSSTGKALFFPKGILTQSAEAKSKAHRYNATIGIATEGGHAMSLDCVHQYFQDLTADNAILMRQAMVILNYVLSGKRSNAPKHRFLAITPPVYPW